jgi:Fe2+ or Zn2+ uptake regulation protein
MKEGTKINLKKMLKDASLKVTTSRISILKVLLATNYPETIQNIHKKLKSIDIVTLYRTINSFEKNSLVRKVDLHKDTTYYELNIEHHHHIICTKCGLVEDFKSCNIKDSMQKIIRKALNFKYINGHSFEFFGICNACIER